MTEMMYPFKPTSTPIYTQSYLPSSRDDLYAPTDNPKLVSQTSYAASDTDEVTAGHHQNLPNHQSQSPEMHQIPRPLSVNADLSSIGIGYTGIGETYTAYPQHKSPFTTAWAPKGVLPTPTIVHKASYPSKPMSGSKYKLPTTRRPRKTVDKSDKDLGIAAIAGIVIGSLVSVALLAGKF